MCLDFIEAETTHPLTVVLFQCIGLLIPKYTGAKKGILSSMAFLTLYTNSKMHVYVQRSVTEGDLNLCLCPKFVNRPLFTIIQNIKSQFDFFSHI